MSFTVEVAGKTDVGCVRTNNEDNFGYDTRQGIFIVCDGMGGQAAGEVASKMAVDSVLTYFREAAKNGSYPEIGPQPDGVSTESRALASAVHLANQAIHDTAAAHASQKGMGATIVMLMVHDNFFSIGHVGDSRIYLLREGELHQLTNDHSLVMEQVRRGLITREEAEHSEMQNIIIRALGPEASVEPDLDDQMAREGDILLLATDGLTKLVADEKLQLVLQSSSSLEQKCDDLIAAAREGGGDDNITCVLVRIVRQPWYKQLLKKILPGGGRPQWQNSI